MQEFAPVVNRKSPEQAPSSHCAIGFSSTKRHAESLSQNRNEVMKNGFLFCCLLGALGAGYYWGRHSGPRVLSTMDPRGTLSSGSLPPAAPNVVEEQDDKSGRREKLSVVEIEKKIRALKAGSPMEQRRTFGLG
jgi:hypothetical protein